MTVEDDRILKDTLTFHEPFGAVVNDGQVVFTVSIEDADSCSLVLYKKKIKEPIAEIPMKHMAGNVYQVKIDNKKLNADYYLYKAGGIEFADPYAKLLTGRNQFGKRKKEDKAGVRCIIENSRFDWNDDKLVVYNWNETIVYKLHVRGFSKTADIPLGHRGTYLGIADMSSYFNELGVNTLLLMPCVEFDEIMDLEHDSYGRPEDYIKREIGRTANKEEYTEENCKVNYWGYLKQYNYFAPKASFATKSCDAIIEFKTMVKELHKKNIAVIMEMQFSEKIPIRLIVDCIKYWALEYHVDGFKISANAAAYAALLSEPCIADKKIILPEFYIEHKNYDAGKKHKRLAVFNDGYMYDVRMFLKGDESKKREFIDRISKGQTETGVINYITDHNGFTLMDLYSYDYKHNEGNGEENKDGTDQNFSWNCGVEGKSKRKDITALRLKMRKNAIAALMFSQGTPMIYAGDEFGNSQNGNNNAYCQDNTTGWVEWKSKKANEELYLFVKQLIQIKVKNTMLHFPYMMRKMDYITCGYPDLTFHGTKAWYPDYSDRSRVLGMLLCGKYAASVSGKEEEDLYIVFNMHWEAHNFDIPSINPKKEWVMVLTTEVKEQKKIPAGMSNTRQFMIAPRSIALFMSRVFI